ncbi:MAG: exonuclease SbcCD subunit D [Gordonia sp. (in: high G+C Gram-positive bacteria)]
MRILHTSDWHLGRTFHGVGLLDDQRYALARLAEVVAAESVDVVIVAGDVYDRSVPSADAVQVYDTALAAIAAAGAQIVVTSGNHDSPARLGVGSHFAAAGGLHLRTTIAGIDRPVLVSDEFGELAIYGVPYLEPETARTELGVPDASGHAEVLSAAMDRVRADITGRGVRSVVVAHAFVVGALACGSERSISVGGVETVGAEVFSGIDYVALGHLHSPQVITEQVRYSGSLLPYSFGERSDRKAAWLIDFDAAGVSEIRSCELPRVRGLSTLCGVLDDLLVDDAYADLTDDYIEATLIDPVRPLDAMRRLRERFPYAVHLTWQRPEVDGGIDYRARVHGRSDAEIITSFITDMRDAPTARERELLGSALRAVVGEPEAETAGVVGELTLFDMPAPAESA